MSSAPGLTVRAATAGDLGAVHAIYGHHVRHGCASFDEVPPSLAELGQRREAVLAAGLPYLVAELDGRVAGYSYATAYRARSAYRFTVENSVYVAPGCARRGAGRALMDALIAACERGPWRQMIAVIGDSANHASIGLHRDLGFTLIGTLVAVGFKHGRWLDSVLMQRALGPGAAGPPRETAV